MPKAYGFVEPNMMDDGESMRRPCIMSNFVVVLLGLTLVDGLRWHRGRLIVEVSHFFSLCFEPGSEIPPAPPKLG